MNDSTNLDYIDSSYIKYFGHTKVSVSNDSAGQITVPVCEIRIPLKTKITLAGKVYGDLPSTNPNNRILAIHGWLDNCELFSDIAPRIVANFYKNNETVSFIALDSVGHGLSDHRAEDYGEVYYLWDYIADFSSAIDVLGWKSCDLIGHSYGGIIAFALAGIYPLKITGLLIYENLGFMNFQTPDMHPMIMAEYIRMKTSSVKRASKRTPKIFPTFDAACKNRTAGRYFISPIVAKKLLRRGLKRIRADPSKNTPAGYIYTYDTRIIYSNFIAPITWTLDQVKAFFEKIRCQTQIILATDGLYQDGDTEGRMKYLNHVKHLDFNVVKGHHHFLLEDESIEDLSKLSNNFFDSLRK